jgi:hypothetical protein
VTDFDDIVNGLHLEEPEDGEVADITKMSYQELLDIMVATDEDLMNAREARFPKTQWARDLHSLRAAAQIELHRRTGGK